MPLKRYLEGEPHVMAADDNLIRFGMTDGERVIGVELPIDLLRAHFPGSDDPLELYRRNQAAIEAAASRAYDRIATPNDLMEMTADDFRARDDVPTA